MFKMGELHGKSGVTKTVRDFEEAKSIGETEKTSVGDEHGARALPMKETGVWEDGEEAKLNKVVEDAS